MISDKMKDLVANSSVIRAMFEDGKIMADKYGKENVYDFSLGNPSIVPPSCVKKAIIDIVNNEPEMLIHGYMNNAGYQDVRDTIANYLNKTHGTDFTQDNIIMTVGAAGGLNIALKAITNPGEEIIVIAPYFGEYNSYIKNVEGIKVVISPDIESFSVNFKELEEKITDKTRAVIINSPNNPTGAVYSEADIIKLAEILEKKQREFNSVIYIISDEPYRELVFDGVKVPYLTKYYKNTIVGYSFSKSLSLPGERIGYLVIPNEADGFEDLFSAINTANRIMGFVNAPSLMQRVIGRVIGCTSDISVYEENKKILCSALKEYGYEFVEPKGTFYMFPRSPIADDSLFCKIAKEYRLIIVPGSSFGCPGHFRIAYCVDKETVLNSLDSFKQLAERFRG